MCGAAHAQENSWGIRAGMNISNLDRYSLHIIGGISVKKNHADKNCIPHQNKKYE